MKHLLGELLVGDNDTDDEDDVEVVWAETLNCVCCWADVNPGLLAETKTVYWLGGEAVGKMNVSMYDPDWSAKTSCTCTGGSFTCMETPAPMTGLFWLSETLPDIVTVSPGEYWALFVDTVTDKVLWEETSGTSPRIDRMATTVRSLREVDS